MNKGVFYLSILLILIILPIVGIVALRIMKEVIISVFRTIIATLCVFFLLIAGYVILWDLVGIHIPSTPPIGIAEIIKSANNSQSYTTLKEHFTINKNKEYDLLGNEISTSENEQPDDSPLISSDTKNNKERAMDSTQRSKEISLEKTDKDQLGFINTTTSRFFSVYEWNKAEGKFELNTSKNDKDYLNNEPFFQQPLIMKTLDAGNEKYTGIYRIMIRGDEKILFEFQKRVPLVSKTKLNINEIRKHKISKSYDLITFGKDIYLLKNSN
ncbi:hypothetical protein ACFVIX_06585 [Bacillus subtilis]|uniref:hypothetical protein n=1 Tax=Bacillus subtilis group TaxID=653685 RepID=UPI00080C954A|nr:MULTISPECIES: hypothetical protein [Bacillus subtilis group]MDK7656943.1 hypothetical protein [Bacillus subtilis]MDQ4711587.1 hypothetical protein [Bacillus subtilis]UNL91920.1 hypothetical protein IE382_23320 [Bacillus subtilis]